MDATPVGEMRLRHEQLVRAPLAAVWSACADPMRQSEWQSAVRGVEMLTPGPVGPGSKYRLRLRAGVRHVPIDVENLEMVPMRLIIQRVDYLSQKFTTLDRCELTEVDDGVMVTMSSWFVHIGAVKLGISKAFRFLENYQHRRLAVRLAAVVERG